jgi:hypothetical protein
LVKLSIRNGGRYFGSVAWKLEKSKGGLGVQPSKRREEAGPQSLESAAFFNQFLMLLRLLLEKVSL